MRAVIQRVSFATVDVEGSIIASIKKGLLVLLGVEDQDTMEDIHWLAAKICDLRIFSDEEGLMNLSLRQVQGDLLLVSQFTLHASIKKGRRPSFIRSAKPQQAELLYNQSIAVFEEILQKKIATGSFGAMMKISLQNDGRRPFLMLACNVN